MKTELRFVEADAGELAAHAGAVDDLYAQRIQGLIVRGLIPPEELGRVVDRLERGAHQLPCAPFPGHEHRADPPHVLGRAIVSTEPDLVRYFEEAASFRLGCRALFAGAVDFEERIEGALSALAGGRQVRLPPSYTPATIRVLPEGHEIGVHVGNGFLRLPQARQLGALIDPVDQLSYFVPLTTPERGGALVVYGLEWADVAPYLPEPTAGPRGHSYDASATPDAEALIELYPKIVLQPGPGDLILFDGGRYYHRISRVGGPRPRRTIGGFAALSRDHRSLYYWS